MKNLKVKILVGIIAIGFLFSGCAARLSSSVSSACDIEFANVDLMAFSNEVFQVWHPGRQWFTEDGKAHQIKINPNPKGVPRQAELLGYVNIMRTLSVEKIIFEIRGRWYFTEFDAETKTVTCNEMAGPPEPPPGIKKNE